jgi:hypothetical protein
MGSRRISIKSSTPNKSYKQCRQKQIKQGWAILEEKGKGRESAEIELVAQ